MLWYKAWIETRWWFLIGLAILICSAALTASSYERVLSLLPLVPQTDLGEPLNRKLAESAALAQTFRGYIWGQWFLGQFPQTWSLLAAALGAGGLVSLVKRGGAVFLLSLPISRTEWFRTRVLTGLAELFVLTLVPSLAIPLFSAMSGHAFGVGDSLVHALCFFLAGSAYFSLAVLLATVFTDMWRPFLIVFGLSLADQSLRDFGPISVFRVMSAEPYFRGQGLPWIGLLVTVSLSLLLLRQALANLQRRDF